MNSSGFINKNQKYKFNYKMHRLHRSPLAVVHYSSQATSSHPLILGWGGGPQLVNNPSKMQIRKYLVYSVWPELR
jgi:hypothetical protein